MIGSSDSINADVPRKTACFRGVTAVPEPTQWVGVIQVPGLQVEILPKIDEADLNGKNEKETQARSNLLYMLSVAGQVPVRERDVARLASRKASLSETLAAIFADRLPP